MIINPIHKKGDKSNPENYRAIALLSIPGKAFNKILLERIKDQTGKAIKETQFGFRPGRGTRYAIFVIRQLMEKVRERKIPLHFNFIDFKSTFDTIWRNSSWKMIRPIGVNTKIVDIIEYMYENTECVVLIKNNLT